MAEVPKRYFERFFVLAGMVFIALLVWAVVWMHNSTKLQSAEEDLYSRFSKFHTYSEAKYFPNIKVLGPKGDFINPIRRSNKFTVLNIWKTSCSSCTKELLSLNKLNKMLTYEMGWQVIAVSVDKSKNLPKVAKFVSHYKIEDIANYNDYNHELQKNLDISNLPMTLIISDSGRILYQMHGSKLWHDKTIIDFFKLVKKVY